MNKQRRSRWFETTWRACDIAFMKRNISSAPWTILPMVVEPFWTQIHSTPYINKKHNTSNIQSYLFSRDCLSQCYLANKTAMLSSEWWFDSFNTLRPRQNGRHFADDIFNCIFLNENVWIPIRISLKFVPKGQINNIPALVQIIAWRRPGDKPLSEPMMVSLPTHICVTRPQWVN